MKKIWIICLLVWLLVGCGNNNIKELDMNKVNSDLQKTDLFPSAEMVDLDYLQSKYGLSNEGIKNASVYMSLTARKASMYAIFEVSNDTARSNIKKDFIDKYVFSWTNVVYDAYEADLVNNMHSESYGNYEIYIISSNNDQALNLIKG